MAHTRFPHWDNDDPMGTNIVHHLLVNSQRLQAIPAWGVTATLLSLTLIVTGVWQDWLAGGLTLLSMTINWMLLWMLPRAGKSFGPDRPSTLALALVMVVLATLIGLLRLPVLVLGLLFAVLNSIVFYSTWIAPFRLGVSYEQLGISTPNGKPLRLLHIGDLHIERITDREKKLNHLIEALQPDVIVFSGDFVNVSYTNDARAEADIREIIRQWHAPLGVYCVGGTYTVEPIERVRAFCAGLDNLRLLEDEWVTINAPQGTLALCGLQTTHRLKIDRAKLEALWRKAPPADRTLLLAHTPDVAPEADQLGFDLYLCGHTHGGQLRLPFVGAIFTGSALGRRFAMGRYELSHLTVYTSRGVGMEGLGAPRARFLCPPEIILWEISVTPETR